MLCYWVAVSFYILSSVVVCGVRSCNESLHVHIMLHSSEISFRSVAQGGFLQTPHYIIVTVMVMVIQHTGYGVFGTLL